MIHIDVKKVGRIPDGGGWRIHGRGSDQAKSAERSKRKTKRGGYVYLHSTVDGYSRFAYAEALADEKATTAIAFMHRACAWFTAQGMGLHPGKWTPVPSAMRQVSWYPTAAGASVPGRRG